MKYTFLKDWETSNSWKVVNKSYIRFERLSQAWADDGNQIGYHAAGDWIMLNKELANLANEWEYYEGTDVKWLEDEFVFSSVKPSLFDYLESKGAQVDGIFVHQYRDPIRGVRKTYFLEDLGIDTPFWEIEKDDKVIVSLRNLINTLDTVRNQGYKIKDKVFCWETKNHIIIRDFNSPWIYQITKL